MKKTEEMDIVPIVTGEVFLQDKIVDERHCYICKKEFNKYDDQDVLLLRKNKGEMLFACDKHRGIVQEFIKQYRNIPGNWRKE